MKIIKLYSNNDIFENIEFKENINFILSTAHSVGKTKLLELIDYCLLSTKNNFAKIETLKNISDLVFYIEIYVNNKYITIKRKVHGRSGIGIKSSQYSEYHYDSKYDFIGSLDKAKKYLDELIDFRFFDKRINFRKYLGYFLRTQNDQKDVFKLDRYIKDRDYKPLVANMLGIEGELILEKYNDEDTIKDQEKEINKLKHLLGDNITRNYIKDEIASLENIKKDKEEQYRQFNFYLGEKNINKQLVDDVEKQINALNKQRSSISREIAYINSSVENNFLIDMNEIELFFKEIEIEFPKALQQEYEKVLLFNKTIADERLNILKDNKKEFLKQVEEIEIQLVELDKKRQSMLSLLTGSDTMGKFKKLEQEVVDISVNIENKKNQLKQFDDIEEKTKELNNKKDEIKEKIECIKKKVNSINETNAIKFNILKYARIIFGEEALFTVGLNSSNNIEFSLKLSNNNNFDNKRDEGNTIKKLLSFLFSISILVSYKDVNFFKFAVLDSPFDGDKTDYQKGLYKAIKEISSDYDLQIIITTIDDEIKDEIMLQESKDLCVKCFTEENKLMGDF